MRGVPLAALALLLCATAARAESYLRLEGLVGQSSSTPFSSASVTEGPPDRPWHNPAERALLAWGGRGEAGHVFDAGGWFFRAGVIGSGWQGRQSVDNPLYAAVIFEPGPEGQKPEGTIKVCDEPCISLDQEQRRSYWEVMPDLAVGLADGELRYWFGLNPFYGEFEQSAHSYMPIAFYPSGRMGASNELDSEVYGLLVTARVEAPVTESLSLAVSLGVGPYAVETTSVTRGPNLGANLKESDSSLGVRGQLGLGLDYALGGGFSLGLVGRADWWSKQPATAAMDAVWNGPACFRINGDLVCEPPKLTDEAGLQEESRLDLFVGMSLGFRF